MAEDRSIGSLLENVHPRLTTVDNVTEQTDERQSQVINISLTSFKFFVLLLYLYVFVILIDFTCALSIPVVHLPQSTCLHAVMYVLPAAASSSCI